MKKIFLITLFLSGFLGFEAEAKTMTFSGGSFLHDTYDDSQCYRWVDGRSGNVLRIDKDNSTGGLRECHAHLPIPLPSGTVLSQIAVYYSIHDVNCTISARGSSEGITPRGDSVMWWGGGGTVTGARSDNTKGYLLLKPSNSSDQTLLDDETYFIAADIEAGTSNPLSECYITGVKIIYQ